MSTGFETNLAIFQSWGLDPSRIRHGRNGGPTLTFDKDIGPILTLEWMLHRNGKPYTEDGENVATELRRYRLVPIDDEETT